MFNENFFKNLKKAITWAPLSKLLLTIVLKIDYSKHGEDKCKFQIFFHRHEKYVYKCPPSTQFYPEKHLFHLKTCFIFFIFMKCRRKLDKQFFLIYFIRVVYLIMILGFVYESDFNTKSKLFYRFKNLLPRFFSCRTTINNHLLFLLYYAWW